MRYEYDVLIQGIKARMVEHGLHNNDMHPKACSCK